MKNWVKGVKQGSRDLLLKFWDRSISREWLEPETSHLTCRFITRGTNEGNAKLAEGGSGRGHVTYFWNYGTPSISRERLELETSNLARESKMPMSVTINRSNRHRKYKSTMADVRFLKSEVLITQAFFELSYQNLVLR